MAHGWSQPPQWLVSASVSTQSSPHIISGATHDGPVEVESSVVLLSLVLTVTAVVVSVDSPVVVVGVSVVGVSVVSVDVPDIELPVMMSVVGVSVVEVSSGVPVVLTDVMVIGVVTVVVMSVVGPAALSPQPTLSAPNTPTIAQLHVCCIAAESRTHHAMSTPRMRGT
jgi:hypothetical protein